jgi:hypothetical protein
MATWVAELARLGPFFAVESHAAGAAPPPPWLPMADLVGDGAALTDRVRSVRAALAVASGQAPEDVELRVAASVTQLGIAARLISPVLGAAVTSGAVPHLDLEDVWWQPALGGAFPLSIPGQPSLDTSAAAAGSSSAELAAGIGRTLLDGPIAAVVTAVLNAFPISTQILWGNVASAVNGAATMITTQRPELAPQAHAVAAGLLGQPVLSATHADVGPRFRRRSCCLIYRISPASRDALCADCVLDVRSSLSRWRG